MLSSEPIDVVIVDNDLEDRAADEISIVMGEEAYVYTCIKTSEVNTEVVHQVFRGVDL